MRFTVSIFMLVLMIYYISNPSQAQHDITVLLNHAMPYVKQTFQHFLSLLKSVQH